MDWNIAKNEKETGNGFQMYKSLRVKAIGMSRCRIPQSGIGKIVVPKPKKETIVLKSKK